MNFDWFTIAAQAVNLLILIFLLHRFLYKPVSEAMDERRKKIDEKFEKADKLIEENEQKKEELKQKEKEISDRKDEILYEAKEDAKEKSKEILAEAKENAKEKQDKWLANFEKEKKKMIEHFRRDIGQYAFMFTSQILNDMADQDIESQIIRKFGTKIDDLIQDKDKDIKQIIEKAEGKINIETSFEINKEQKERIEKVIHEKIDIEQIEYEINKDMIAGISLSIDGHQIKWSIEDYIDNLEDKYLNELNEIREEDQSK